jgi:pimeloyl-ACP methyl ester carboxylesterase/DNA-binding CsgD family transcriptional regulator
MVLLCMPVFRSDAPDEVSRVTTVVWVFADRSVAAPSVKSLADLFGISPAEARLLHLLCKVGNLSQSAELLSVSVHTARTQLKSIMGKTGISSQVALVSRAMSHALLATPTLATHDGHEERFMVLPDHRVLSWFEYGCPEGKPLLVMENQAGNMPCHEPHHDWYVSQGLRVLVVVRPGFGISSPCPNGSFVDFADDLRYFCERLNLQQPILAGYCFGGPYALAAAARYPSLFQQVGVIGSLVPWQYMHSGQLDPMHDRLLKMVDRDPRIFISLGKMALRGVNRSPEKFFSFFSRFLDPKDASLINDPAVQAITLPQLRQRWFQGARVIIDDYLRVLRPWKFELTDITIPTQVWHGALDRSVQVESARAMAEAIPGAQFHVLENQGRYPVIECWQEFVEALAGSIPQTITQRA